MVINLVSFTMYSKKPSRFASASGIEDYYIFMSNQSIGELIKEHRGRFIKNGYTHVHTAKLEVDSMPDQFNLPADIKWKFFYQFER